MGILISGVEIEAHRGIPLYLAPGVTRVTFENSRLTGRSCSVGIYLYRNCGEGGTVRHQSSEAQALERMGREADILVCPRWPRVTDAGDLPASGGGMPAPRGEFTP